MSGVLRGLGYAVAAAWAFTPLARAQTFTDVTEDSGIGGVRRMRPAGLWMSGINLVDLDGDGRLDYFEGAHTGSGAIAALNDGRGHFTAVANAPWAQTELHVLYDLNEDGKVDLVTTEGDGGGRWWLNRSQPGMPVFALLNVSDAQSRAQSMIDLNRDGNVDWFVSDDAPRGPPNKARLYLGDGKGGLGAAMNFPLGIMPLPLDIDGDGDIDVIGLMGNRPSSPEIPVGTKLYRNDGPMGFKDVTAEAGLDKAGLWILGPADVDADGDSDLVAIDDQAGFPLAIYLNDGAGVFTRKAGAISGPSGGKPMWAETGLAVMTDLDNDGVGDLVATGCFYLHVLRGTGGGSFQYMNQNWGGIVNTANRPDSGFAFGDIDGDGDLDLIGYRPNATGSIAPIVYRNDLPAQNWINVRPVGLPGNRGAAGAKVRVFEAGTGKLLWYEEVIIRAKQVQQSYYALAETERHFGLGARTSVDVTVHFYPSNKLVRQNGVKANSTVRISEDGNGTIVTPSATPPVQNAVDASVAAMDGGAKLDASTSTDGGARGDGAAEGSAGARVGAEMREADGPTGVAPEAAPGPAGCGCRFGGRSRSGGGGALLLVLTCLARRRRARGVRTADVDAAVAAIVL